MKKIIRLTESELTKIIKKAISEAEPIRRTSNLSDPESFLPAAQPAKSTYNMDRPKINYPNIPEPKIAPKDPIAPKTIFGIGDKGKEILSFQKHLQALGYNVGKNGPDGIFGPDTEAVVKDFQARNGITVSGRVGPPTKGKLITMVNKPKQSYDPTAEWNQDRREDGMTSSSPSPKTPTSTSTSPKAVKSGGGGWLTQSLRDKPVKGFEDLNPWIPKAPNAERSLEKIANRGPNLGQRLRQKDSNQNLASK